MKKVVLVTLACCVAGGVVAKKKKKSKEPEVPSKAEIVISLPKAHKGDLETDMNLLNSYGKQPEDIQAFFKEARIMFEEAKPSKKGKSKKGKKGEAEVAPKHPFEGFADNTKLLEISKKYNVTHLGGPLLGCVSDTEASVWVRTVQPAQVTVTVKGPGGELVFGPVASTSESQLSAVVPMTGLKAETKYTCTVSIDGKAIETSTDTAFTTYPAPGTKGTFKMAFGADFHKAGLHNKYLINQIVDRGNTAMLLQGDSAVDDRNEWWSMHRSDYLLRDLAPAWQKLAQSMPLYATWDDHDYLNNDVSGSKDENQSTAKNLRKIWQENWNNPAYGENGLGIYFSTQIGPANVIVLDTRSLRKRLSEAAIKDFKGEKDAFLGKRQMEWLKETLLKSKGPFTIISSGTMWSDYISNGKDSWGKYDPEGREELFQFIEENKIPGVILLSGDRHGSRGFTIPRKSGYKFYEFEMGSLGAMKGPGAEGTETGDNQLFGFIGRSAFGEFTFDTTAVDPTVTFRAVDEEGAIHKEIVMTQSQLTPGN